MAKEIFRVKIHISVVDLFSIARESCRAALWLFYGGEQFHPRCYIIISLASAVLCVFSGAGWIFYDFLESF